MPLDPSIPVHARIDELVKSHDVVLFMKGDPTQPQCGFSATAVGELEGIGVDFSDAKVTTVNVLADPDVRQGIKSYSDWPTIPQLYVKTEFIGGSDIIRQSVASGELHGMLGIPFVPPSPPALTVTDAMRDMVVANGGPSATLRLVVPPGFRYQIGFDSQRPDDFVVEANGLKVLVDKGSARRADGITLDFDDGPSGGVTIDNPNEPAQVEQLDVHALKRWLDEGKSFRLLDVRTEQERQTAMLSDKAEALTPELVAELEAAESKDEVLVLHCHHGGRSQQAADHFIRSGYRKVFNVQGGIDAWSLFIDQSVPRY
jgi:monothiol glutaredoxin